MNKKNLDNKRRKKINNFHDARTIKESKCNQNSIKKKKLLKQFRKEFNANVCECMLIQKVKIFFVPEGWVWKKEN